MGKRVASQYQYVLKDLKSSSGRLIFALTLLALEDKEYSHYIVDVINQHLFKVHPDFKLYIIYLIDSIVKTVDGKDIYSKLFSQHLISIVSHVMQTTSSKVQERLRRVREMWNKIFPHDVLYKLDMEIRKIDPLWPHIPTESELKAHLNEIERQKEELEKEIKQLEYQLSQPSATELNNEKKSQLNNGKRRQEEMSYVPAKKQAL